MEASLKEPNQQSVNKTLKMEMQIRVFLAERGKGSNEKLNMPGFNFQLFGRGGMASPLRGGG